MVLLPWDSFSLSEVTGEITGQHFSRLPSGREHKKLQKTSLKNHKPVWLGVYLNENKLKHRSYSDNYSYTSQFSQAVRFISYYFPVMLCFQLYTYLRFTPTWEDNVWITFDFFFFLFLLSLHHNQHYSTKDKAFQEHVFLEVYNLLKTNIHYLSSSLQERDSHTPTCWLAKCWCLMSTLSFRTETAVSGPIPSLFFWISKPAHKKTLSPPVQASFSLTVWSPIMSKGQRHHSQFFFFF